MIRYEKPKYEYDVGIEYIYNIITKVLDLSEKDSKAIYQIQLERFNENKSIEKEYADKPEEKKEKLKALGNKIFNQMKAVLGPERQKKWKEYKENQ